MQRGFLAIPSFSPLLGEARLASKDRLDFQLGDLSSPLRFFINNDNEIYSPFEFEEERERDGRVCIPLLLEGDAKP